MVATEVEGLRLSLSSRSRTGYAGVHETPFGRFQAKHYVDGRPGKGEDGCLGRPWRGPVEPVAAQEGRGVGAGAVRYRELCTAGP